MSGISIWQIMVIFVVLPLFLLPSIIAISRNHPYKVPIVLINIIGGAVWGVGWIVAFIWSLIMPQKIRAGDSDSIGEIERLHALKMQGVITQENFDERKKALLGLEKEKDIYSR